MVVTKQNVTVKGYKVHGIKRRASTFNTSKIDHLYQDLQEEDKFLSTLWRSN